MDDRTSNQIRSLANQTRNAQCDLPLAEIVDLVASQSRDLTIDLQADPPVVYSQPRRDEAFAALSDREREVARLIAAGYSNQQIADALFISLGTAKDHVHAILTKTGFTSRSRVIAAWLGASSLAD